MRDAIDYIISRSRLLDLEPRIMGGELAPFGAYPWVASIELKGANPRDGHFCSGAFIGAEWVLTAAHCVKPDSAGAIQVHSGAELDSGGTIYDVDSVIVNEKYDDGTENNDVALIHLAKRFTGQPIRLAGADDAKRLIEPGALVTVLGWGLTTEGGEVSNLLRSVTVQIVNNKICNGLASYPGLITDAMVCAGFAEGGKDSCQGDGGGPLIVRDPDHGLLQVGIVSWGEGCRRPLKFGVYTRVASIKAWVDEKIGKSPQIAKVAPPAAPRRRSVPLPQARPSPGRQTASTDADAQRPAHGRGRARAVAATGTAPPLSPRRRRAGAVQHSIGDARRAAVPRHRHAPARGQAAHHRRRAGAGRRLSVDRLARIESREAATATSAAAPSSRRTGC